jgi:hypothetical protein
VLGYATAITAVSELIAIASKLVDERTPVHIEVLLPAFVLGALARRPSGSDPHREDTREGHQEGPESVDEQRVSTMVSAVFMLLVGLNMPPMFGPWGPAHLVDRALSTSMITVSQPPLEWGDLLVHALLVTVIANLGKMVPALSYRHEAPWPERLAMAVSLWPRGEVGAGILVISLSYGIGGPVLTVAMLSLAAKLSATGAFILIVQRLMRMSSVVATYPHLLKRKRVGV